MKIPEPSWTEVARAVVFTFALLVLACFAAPRVYHLTERPVKAQALYCPVPEDGFVWHCTGLTAP